MDKATTKPLLAARGLGRRNPKGGWLLEEIDLSVAAGEALAVHGPTGAGKTLLLRALALLDPLDSGCVLWRDEEVSADDVPTFRSAVMYVAQRAALFDETVLENLRLPFQFKSHGDRSFDRERIENWLGQLGRDAGFLEKRHADLSGGEAQVVALLRLLQLDPQVLLLDEPTAALDRESTRRAEQLLSSWLAEAADQRALVWVSHDAAQLERVAKRTVFMERGHIQDSPSGGTRSRTST